MLPLKTSLKRIVKLAAIVTVVVTLISWGNYALQWTTPSPTSVEPLLNAPPNLTFNYHIQPGREQDYRVKIDYPRNNPHPNVIPGTFINESNVEGYILYGFVQYNSTASSWTVPYIIMSVTPNTTYSDPGQDVYRERLVFTVPGGESPVDVSTMGSVMGPSYISYYRMDALGNYTIDIVNPPPPTAYRNATGTVSFAFRAVIYTKPLYDFGLTTFGVAGGFLAVFIIFAGYDVMRGRRGRPRPQERIREPAIPAGVPADFVVVMAKLAQSTL